jgi:hypothetical protein
MTSQTGFCSLGYEHFRQRDRRLEENTTQAYVVDMRVRSLQLKNCHKRGTGVNDQSPRVRHAICGRLRMPLCVLLLHSLLVDDLANLVSSHFGRNFNPEVLMFKSNNAVLTYESLDELIATHPWNGQVGSDKFKLKMSIANGPSIEGPLNMLVEPASSVDGSGTWTQD